jgi:cell division protein FtsW
MNTAAANLPRPQVRGFSSGTVVGVCAIALTLLGMVVLYSAGEGTTRGGVFYFDRQAIWFSVALGAGIVAAFMDMDVLRKYTWVIAGVAVALLVMVLIPHIGVTVKGARRWLNLGLMNAQPSDFGKLALVLCLAHYLALNQRLVTTFGRGFVAPMAIVAVFAGLIIKEPDFGTAALCGLVGCTLLFLAGTRMMYLVPSMLAGAGLFGLAVYLDPVRLRRILSFMDMEANKSDGAYQLWQAIVGFGVGGWDGVGLGQGRQQHYFLPEAHTDFLLAVVGEELGLIATAGVVILFLVIFVVSFRALRRAPNLYEFTVATGALLMLTGQAIINMGVVTGLLPTKGMSLPFLSYGGSNLMLMYVLVGVLVNCFRRWERTPVPEAREI